MWKVIVVAATIPIVTSGNAIAHSWEPLTCNYKGSKSNGPCDLQAGIGTDSHGKNRQKGFALKCADSEDTYDEFNKMTYKATQKQSEVSCAPIGGVYNNVSTQNVLCENNTGHKDTIHFKIWCNSE